MSIQDLITRYERINNFADNVSLSKSEKTDRNIHWKYLKRWKMGHKNDSRKFS